MQSSSPLSLLGGLSPAQFMKQYWQKKPLLVRGALPSFKPLVSRSELFAMAAQEDVECRLIVQSDAGWKVQSGPIPRRSFPPFAKPNWTLLVQGVNLHDDDVNNLLQQFRFIPAARLDDLMISYATSGGGVGPHVDSYDVFLLQAHGQRRWRIGPTKDHELVPDMPLKILANFSYDEEHLLEPGDMLYLPPGWAHDGTAQGECMTYSIGFRAPARDEIARDLLARLSDGDDRDDNCSNEASRGALYRDTSQVATHTPAEIPAALLNFAQRALDRALNKPLVVARVLGESLTEPKPLVWFDMQESFDLKLGTRLDRRARMLYDAQHVFINGESYLASGRDATLMQKLANERKLSSSDIAKASTAALTLLQNWGEAGWLIAERRQNGGN